MIIIYCQFRVLIHQTESQMCIKLDGGKLHMAPDLEPSCYEVTAHLADEI